MNEWMPDNPHKCCCRSEMIRDAAKWEEDARFHAFNAACQEMAPKVAKWLGSACITSGHKGYYDRRICCPECMEQFRIDSTGS